VWDGLRKKSVDRVAFQKVAIVNAKRRHGKTIPGAEESKIWRAKCLGGGFDHRNFFHLETPRTREKRLPGQSSVVDVKGAKEFSETRTVSVQHNISRKAWDTAVITR
jgi:hypothetical protein